MLKVIAVHEFLNLLTINMMGHDSQQKNYK